jgi:hypothetical protein
MKSTERRLRILEALANFKPSKPPRRVIVNVSESLETVLKREGIEIGPGPGIAVIARTIVGSKVIEGDLALPVDPGA